MRSPVSIATVRALRGVLLLSAAAAILTCGGTEPREEPARLASSQTGRVLRIGDVDPDTPARRARRLMPLASHLAENLRDLGIDRGEIVIARNLEEMVRLLSAGQVDLYIDSVYPSLVVRQRAGSEILLLRWAQGAAEYWSVFVTPRDAELSSLEELRGRVVAFQEDYSTSGYALPAGTLRDLGLELHRVEGPASAPRPDRINYFFSRDEENTVELVTTGRVGAGVISNQELAALPPRLADRLSILDRTQRLPRQLLSARGDLETAVVDRVRSVLIGLSPAGAAPVTLEDSPDAWSFKFEEPTAELQAALERMDEWVAEMGSG